MVHVLLIFFVGLIVLLSVNWSERRIDPLVLLLGILVAAIIWVSSRLSEQARRTCVACGRDVVAPPGSSFCHFCGAPLPPEER